MSRSFTYIDDIIDNILKLIDKPAVPDITFDKKNPNPSSSWCPHRIFNLGNKQTIPLLEFIRHIEDELGIMAIREYHEMQPGDVQVTSSDDNLLSDWVGETPQTTIKDGVKIFIRWYENYYG